MARTPRPIILIALIALASCGLAQQGGTPVQNLGSRRELFVDDALIETMTEGARLRLHHPVPQEIALVADAPWEGNGSGYISITADQGVYRMYYRGANYRLAPNVYDEAHRLVYCVAQSTDAIHWTKPQLGLVEFDGSRANNIVLDDLCHSFAPFVDTNPACQPETRYKAVANGGAEHGLYALGSPDGLHWKRLAEKPVITAGALDSQNLAFWDATLGQYRCYLRDFRDGRDIRVCTSTDFLTWSEPQWLEYTPGRSGELYTNQILPYTRAPHLLLGFPTRYADRGWTPAHDHLPQVEHRHMRATTSPREGSAVTEGLFMASRDGTHFRMWPEAFIRPGQRTKDAWFYGDNYQAWGIIETPSALDPAVSELSLYATEGYHQQHGVAVRRFTLRLDGFVSVEAPLTGGGLVTKPFTFQGKELVLNLSSSAAGGVRVEIQEPSGQPVPGFGLDDCPEVFGDGTELPVVWKNTPALAALAGKPVRLRFALRDADLYAFQFR